MAKAVILALTASFFTATSSVCQRLGVRDAPDTDGFSPRIFIGLLRRPIWLIGVASMILGFLFQVAALHYGSLALVQPILATELLFVFGYMAVVKAHPVLRRDWLAGVAMAAGLGLFLFAASPSGTRLHASGSTWWLAGAASLGAVVVVTLMSYAPFRSGTRPSASRRAATLGVATGISWGFVAAIIKELSSRTSTGATGLLSSWSLYVLVAAGAVSMLLATHALRAGPLAASQPGFTIVDPLVASLLGVFVFQEHLRLGAADLTIEIIALMVLVGGVVLLSHSQLVVGETETEHEPKPAMPPSVGGSPSARCSPPAAGTGA